MNFLHTTVKEVRAFLTPRERCRGEAGKLSALKHQNFLTLKKKKKSVTLYYSTLHKIPDRTKMLYAYYSMKELHVKGALGEI